MIARQKLADASVPVLSRDERPIDERSMLVLERIVGLVALAAAAALFLVR